MRGCKDTMAIMPLIPMMFEIIMIVIIILILILILILNIKINNKNRIIFK